MRTLKRGRFSDLKVGTVMSSFIESPSHECFVSKTHSTAFGSDFDWMSDQEKRISQYTLYLDSNEIFAVEINSYLREQNLQLFSKNQLKVQSIREEVESTRHKSPEKRSSFQYLM